MENKRLFNIWNERYANNPEGFKDSTLNDAGEPIEDYGEACVEYLTKLDLEVD